MKKLTFLVLIFIFFINGFSQSNFHGKISGTVEWKGTITIDGDVTILPAGVLKILPGTRIIILANQDVTHAGKDKSKIEIINKGVLIARGEPDNKITFTSAAKEPMMADWYGITIRNKGKTCILDYVVIEYGYFGLNIVDSSPLIMNSEIKYNYMAGINADMRSAPTIQGCVISGNDYAGIKCDYGSSPVISESVITQNGHGVIAFKNSSPFLGKTERRKATGGNNRIFENWETNIYNHSSATIYAQNNNWLTKSKREIAQKIYDAEDDKQYGPVIFSPIQGERRVKQTPPVLATNTKTKNPPVQKNNTLQEKISTKDQGSLNKNIPEVEKSNAASVGKDIAAKSNIVTTKQETKTEPTVSQTTNKPVEKIDAATALKENEQKKQARKEKVNSEFTDIINLKKPALEYQLDNKPIKRIKMVPAEYPPAYVNTGKSGRVFVKVIVNTHGEVESASILKIQGGKEFGAAALKAVRQFKYSVGTFKGQPVRFEKAELFDFKM